MTILPDDSGGLDIVIRNAAERITLRRVELRGDSLFARFPLFDSELHAHIASDSLLSGLWINLAKGPGYRVPFVAVAGKQHSPVERPTPRARAFTGTWETRFSHGTPDAYSAVGEFWQHPGGTVTGTFLTETGDYRFLEGTAHGDSLLLSCFDGTHAYLFAAEHRNDSLIGRFWSGTHWQEPWVAVPNPWFKLRHPDSLTQLSEEADRVQFSFLDTDGVLRSTDDPDIKGRPLLVHIMGSWCPNCVDETSLLKEMYHKYHGRGLNVLAIAFEKHREKDRAIAGLQRFKDVLHVPYPILYGGPAAKSEALEQLPFLKHLMSYPTCVFIDRSGEVKRIRTGFYGPGTGAHYVRYREDLDRYLEELVSLP